MSRKSRFSSGKAESLLAIDFGASSIKLCAGTIQERTLQVERLTEAPLPPDAIREGAILDPETVYKALRTALSHAGIKTKRVYLSVGGPQTTARPIRLPRMNPQTLQKSIQFEATRYLPSAAEEHLIGFQILPFGNEEQMEVLLVAAPRSTTDPLMEVVERAGLEPQLLELQPFSALRTVQALYGATLPFAYALVDLGSEHTQITVARNATLVLTRFIPIASGTLSAALKGYFHYTDEEAEQVKQKLNLTDLLQTGQPQENPPLRLIQPILDELIREIRRSLNYYQSQYQMQGGRGQIERLYLYGGGALMQGMSAYFEYKLGIPAQLLDPFSGDVIVPAHVHPEQLDTGVRWATALGTALAPLEMAAPFAEPVAETEPATAQAAA
ncbi:MAG: pilus assembly protein PilM [Fimbriimonadales bacterium]|nr:MAG: pilus assembly protein PilM [Fimbriimonadales bacterium]GIV08256.1 MAG: pilus assembly protein PilM [Fimbriimonadales bacterium]